MCEEGEGECSEDNGELADCEKDTCEEGEQGQDGEGKEGMRVTCP